MPDHTYTFRCKLCDNIIDVVLTDRQNKKYQEYLKGNIMHIQNALPDLNPSERELFISGICDACWNKMFNCQH